MFRSTFHDNNGIVHHDAMARTSPNSESVFNEKPSASMIEKVPTTTPAVREEMMEARHVCKKTKTTITTKLAASTKCGPRPE